MNINFQGFVQPGQFTKPSEASTGRYTANQKFLVRETQIVHYTCLGSEEHQEWYF